MKKLNEIYSRKNLEKMMNSLMVLDIARWFIRKAHDKNDEPMTHVRLQKLLYFTWAWYRVSYGERLFDYKFNMMDYGPVHRDVFDVYKNYKGGAPLPIPKESSFPFSDDLNDFLKEVWTEYGTLGTFELSDLSHEDPVWDIEYKKSKSLSFSEKEQMILNFYGKIKQSHEAANDQRLIEQLKNIKYPEDYISLEESEALTNRLACLVCS